MGMSASYLVRFMSDSVAARLHDEKFWRGLNRLKDEIGMSVSDLVRFMSNSLAARLGNEEFLDALALLVAELSPEGTFSLMQTAVASRLSPAYAKSIIRTIQHMD